YARAGLDEMIGDGVDLLLCNQDEAMMYTETSSVDAAMTKLKAISKYVVITMSAEGALISDHENTFKVPGRKVIAVDANGAGDAFAGAFLYGLNANLGLQAAAELAILI